MVIGDFDGVSGVPLSLSQDGTSLFSDESVMTLTKDKRNDIPE